MQGNLKKEVLMVLIRAAVDIMPGIEFISPSHMSAILGKPTRDVRIALKELKQEGLVKYGHEGGYDDYSDRPFCIWGYCITEKAMQLPEYEEAQKQEEELIREILLGGINDE